MDEVDAIVTFRSFTTTFTDFLCVAIHTILYERSIYPETSFLSARKYNFAVRQNRHPRVCAYVLDAVAAVEAELLKGSVDRVVVVIYDKHDTPLERFVFDVSFFPYVPPEHQATPLRQAQAQQDEGVFILPLVDLQEQLRATMVKLTTCSSRLRPLPPNSECTFAVAIELKEDSREPPVGHPQPWIPVQPRLGKGKEKEKAMDTSAANDAQARTVPLRAVEAGYMVFESWIEEAKAKFDTPVSSAED
ncbi:hypothetical protein AAFC00_007110 [Neodothiora populina]|uniref:HORMA domain-containing protein n=1 Tax=Neodothiora populina TaxID=2781224 RepID=A0ABR3PDG1_9PEZI